MRRVLAVFLGGGIGACLRAAALQILGAWGGPFPAPVLLVNLLGAFVLGVVFVLADEAGLLGVHTRLFLAVGVLGGFTTFSTLGWGIDVLVGQGRAAIALVYALASLLGGMTAAAVGLVAGRELVAMLERVASGMVRRLEEGRRRAGSPSGDMALIETEDREESA